MKHNHPSPALGRELKRRKLSDFLTLIPFLGALIFATPILDNFPKLLTIFSIPLPVFLLFGTWLLGIIIVFIANTRMQSLERQQMSALEEGLASRDSLADEYNDG